LPRVEHLEDRCTPSGLLSSLLSPLGLLPLVTQLTSQIGLPITVSTAPLGVQVGTLRLGLPTVQQPASNGPSAGVVPPPVDITLPGLQPQTQSDSNTPGGTPSQNGNTAPSGPPAPGTASSGPGGVAGPTNTSAVGAGAPVIDPAASGVGATAPVPVAVPPDTGAPNPASTPVAVTVSGAGSAGQQELLAALLAREFFPADDENPAATQVAAPTAARTTTSASIPPVVTAQGAAAARPLLIGGAADELVIPASQQPDLVGELHLRDGNRTFASLDKLFDLNDAPAGSTVWSLLGQLSPAILTVVVLSAEAWRRRSAPQATAGGTELLDIGGYPL
jgi:hypothetical protein